MKYVKFTGKNSKLIVFPYFGPIVAVVTVVAKPPLHNMDIYAHEIRNTPQRPGDFT